MTSTQNRACPGRLRIRLARAGAVMVTACLAGVLAACGSGTASPSSTGVASTTSVVKAPDETVQGCTYAPNNSIPAGEAHGQEPPFAAVSSDAAAQDALEHIAAHGGTGLVYGFQIPSGTKLYAGPDTAAATVGVVPTGRSISLYDPVLWTTSSHAQWLVTFLACGGPNPYWISVDHIHQANAAAAQSMSQTITHLLASQDYPTTGQASSLPVVVDATHRFAWKNPAIPFTPARAEYVGFSA